jgi:hypothetical protein
MDMLHDVAAHVDRQVRQLAVLQQQQLFAALPLLLLIFPPFLFAFQNIHIMLQRSTHLLLARR